MLKQYQLFYIEHNEDHSEENRTDLGIFLGIGDIKTAISEDKDKNDYKDNREYYYIKVTQIF